MERVPLDEGRRALVEANLGLAVALARRLRGASRVPLGELIQEASMGLVIAAGYWREGAGPPFGTYAASWVMGRIRLAIVSPGPIRVAACARRATMSPRTRAAAAAAQRTGPIAAPIAAPRAEELRYAEEIETLPGHLLRLSPQQREVIRQRFDLGRTQAEVGADLGVTKARVSQVEAEAIDLLRSAYGVPAAGPRPPRTRSRPRPSSTRGEARP